MIISRDQRGSTNHQTTGNWELFFFFIFFISSSDANQPLFSSLPARTFSVMLSRFFPPLLGVPPSRPPSLPFLPLSSFLPFQLSPSFSLSLTSNFFWSSIFRCFYFLYEFISIPFLLLLSLFFSFFPFPSFPFRSFLLCLSLQSLFLSISQNSIFLYEFISIPFLPSFSPLPFPSFPFPFSSPLTCLPYQYHTGNIFYFPLAFNYLFPSFPSFPLPSTDSSSLLHLKKNNRPSGTFI